MRKTAALLIIALCSIMANAQTKILLKVGDKTCRASLYSNQATQSLSSILAEGPITVDMADYGGFEKVGALPLPLPAADRQISTLPGDIMLYQGRNIVIFYGNNSWSYTPLGKIDNATASSVKEFLGSGDIKLTLSLYSESGVESPVPDQYSDSEVYNLQGQIVTVRPLPPGLYIVNGRKTIVPRR